MSYKFKKLILICLTILFLQNYILLYSKNTETTITKQKIQKKLIAKLPLIENQKIIINADTVYRNLKKDSITAKGHVIAKFQESILHADDIEYYDKTSIANSKGNIRMLDKQNYIKGDSLIYTINTGTGTINNAKTLYAPWVIKGTNIEKVSKNKSIIKNAIITSCDYDKPDYYFKAKKVIVYQEDKFIAYNVVLYIKGIPILYLPFFKKSLKKLIVQITATLGQNSIDGWYEKLTIRYPFNENSSLTSYIDKYDYRGLGLGLQYDYKNKDIKNGSIYIYGIDDRVDKTNKRTLRINHFQKLTPTLKLYTNINYQNDQAFNNDFLYTGSASTLSSSGNRINSDIYSYSSLNYFKDLYSVMLTWERNDSWDDTQKQYIQKTELLPSITFNTNTNKLSFKKNVKKKSFNNITSNTTEVWDDLIEKGYLTENGNPTIKFNSLYSADELDIKENLITKQNFNDINHDSTLILNELINKKYIDKNGKILEKFKSTNNIIEFEISDSLNEYKNKIFTNLKKVEKINTDTRKKIFSKLQPFFNNLFYNYNFQASNVYKQQSNTYYRTMHTSFSLTNTFKINNAMTLSPMVGIREIIDQSATLENQSLTKLDSSINLKNILTDNIDMDFTYFYTVNLFGTNHDIDTNKVTAAFNGYFFDGKLKIKTASGYNFTINPLTALTTWDDLTTELRFKYNKYINNYTRYQYSISNEKVNLLQNIIYFYPSPKISFSENTAFQASNPGMIDTISTIKYRPNLKWKVDYSYRANYDYNNNEFLPNLSKEIAIYRDLHCWEVKLSILEKPDQNANIYREIWIIFNLKSIPEQQLSLYRNNQNYPEWYYWDIKNKS